MSKKVKVDRHPFRRMSGEEKTKYLSQVFDEVCAGKITMEEYEAIKEEVRK